MQCFIRSKYTILYFSAVSDTCSRLSVRHQNHLIDIRKCILVGLNIGFNQLQTGNHCVVQIRTRARRIRFNPCDTVCSHVGCHLQHGVCKHRHFGVEQNQIHSIIVAQVLNSANRSTHCRFPFCDAHRARFVQHKHHTTWQCRLFFIREYMHKCRRRRISRLHHQLIVLRHSIRFVAHDNQLFRAHIHVVYLRRFSDRHVDVNTVGSKVGDVVRSVGGSNHIDKGNISICVVQVDGDCSVLKL
mmetsp:Transcript_60188/g.99395  ORF Transcript_60188/g.99395 Transcript_60188/m.99395 type:complete len:243 (+) Transcript_60188:835-1563(+)